MQAAGAHEFPLSVTDSFRENFLMTRASLQTRRPQRIARIARRLGVTAAFALPVPAFAQLHAPDAPRLSSTAAEQLYAPESPPPIVFDRSLLLAQGNESRCGASRRAT
jgi:hypothetical protein